jgi:hypothetical protein
MEENGWIFELKEYTKNDMGDILPPGWYFYNEGYIEYGPYPSKSEAAKEMIEYSKELNRGRNDRINSK